MESLFGVPTMQLMWALLAVFGAGLILITASALRNRVSFRMAARNLPRRRAQTALVVLGLMLATMLFSASFTTGDTLTNSLRLQSLENLGQVDVQVRAEGQSSSGGEPFGETTAERARYFDEGIATQVREKLSGSDRVAGVVAAAGLWLERPEAGPPPRVDVVAEAPPSCGELADGLARAACNAR